MLDAAGNDVTTEADPTADAVCGALVDDLDAGFSELMTTYQGLVYSVALGTRGNPADAEDLAAEAFLRAYRALRGYDAERIRGLRLRSWLLTIARNAARNAARDAGRRPGAPPRHEPAEELSPGPSVEDRIVGGEEQDRLRTLLGHLPEVQRTAVVLRHVVDLTNGEVGEVLGCPEGTARSHVSRGLKRLRTLLSEQDRAAEQDRAVGGDRTAEGYDAVLRKPLESGRAVR